MSTNGRFPKASGDPCFGADKVDWPGIISASLAMLSVDIVWVDLITRICDLLLLILP